MSKLIENIQCQLVGKVPRFELLDKFSFDVDAKVETSKTVIYDNRYLFIATFSKEMICREDKLEGAIKEAIHQLTYDIYGEFHRGLVRLKGHIYGQEWDDSMTLIDEIIQKIKT